MDVAVHAVPRPSNCSRPKDRRSRLMQSTLATRIDDFPFTTIPRLAEDLTQEFSLQPDETKIVVQRLADIRIGHIHALDELILMAPAGRTAGDLENFVEYIKTRRAQVKAVCLKDN